MVVRCAGAHDDALAMYCVQALLDALRRRAEGDDGTVELDASHKQRLRLTLASTISSVPTSLLPQVLDELKNLATHSSDGPTATTFTIEETQNPGRWHQFPSQDPNYATEGGT